MGQEELKEPIVHVSKDDGSDSEDEAPTTSQLVKLDSSDYHASVKKDPVKELKLAKILFYTTIIYPGLGIVSYYKYRHSPKGSQRYIWAHRGMVLGTMLAVIYAYLFCCLVYYVLGARKTDLMGYSYSNIQRMLAQLAPA